MKKCPACGAKNNRHCLICGSCGASLEELTQQQQQTQASSPEAKVAYRPTVGGPDSVTAYRPTVGGPGSIGEEPVQTGGPLGGNDQQPEEPLTMVGQPLNIQAQQQSPYQNNGMPQSQPYGAASGPRKMKYREMPDIAPVQTSALKSSIGSILMLIILLAGGWYSYQRFVVKPRPALQAVQTFISAATSNNWQQMQGTIDQNSAFLLSSVYKNQAMRGTQVGLDFFSTSGQEFSQGKQYKLKVVKMTETTAQVRVCPGPSPIPTYMAEQLPDKFKDGFLINLTNVNGSWKINLTQFTADLASCGYPYNTMAKYFVSRGY